MKKKNNNFLFNLIAPVYGLFYSRQKKQYRKDLSILQNHMDFATFNSVIDIGCGTGAMCSVLHKYIPSVTGIDPAKRMLKIGKRKRENNNVNFVYCERCDKFPFEDDNFDFSIASFVAHGLTKKERKTLYKEMSRISKHIVLFYDYNETRSFFTSVIEWLEGGDYFNFIKHVTTELNESFQSVTVVPLNKRASWYICIPYSK